MDNSDTAGVSAVGNWKSATAPSGYWGAAYLHDNGTSKSSNALRWTPLLPQSGRYEVSARWPVGSPKSGGLSTAVPYTIYTPAGTYTLSRNQSTAGGTWVSLGTYSFSAGRNLNTGAIRLTNNGTSGTVTADAVRWVWVSP